MNNFDKLVQESPDSSEYDRLYDLNIAAITSLTESEVRIILVLLRGWGYQWEDDQVSWDGFEMEAATLR